MDDDNITKIALRKLIRNEKLTDAEEIAIEDSYEANSRFRKGAVKILKSWVTWAIMLASSSVAEIFNFINLVD